MRKIEKMPYWTPSQWMTMGIATAFASDWVFSRGESTVEGMATSSLSLSLLMIGSLGFGFLLNYMSNRIIDRLDAGLKDD